MANTPKFKIGDAVKFNGGFDGTVIDLCPWTNYQMVTIRSRSGSCCIPVQDADPVKE